MRDLVALDRVVHRRRAHLAQAHMRSRDDRDGPGKAPAVAVEHRQGPEIDAVPAHAAGENVADREQIRAAVVIDDALRIAGGARGVVERDRVPLVVRHFPGEVRIARGDELLVFECAEPLTGAGEFGIVVIDEQWLGLGACERVAREPAELAVSDQHLRLGMVELERDGCGIEPRVDGVEHRARHRHAVVAFQHRRRVGEHDRDGVTALDAALRQGRSEAARAGVKLAIAAPQRPVNDRGVIGKYRRRPFQERERRKRLEIRRTAIEIDVV